MTKQAAQATPRSTKKSLEKDSQTLLNFNGNQHYRKIYPAKSQFICHPSAKDAYIAWASIPRCSSVGTLHANLQRCLINTPIYLTQVPDPKIVDGKTFYFFESFESVQHLRACADLSFYIPALILKESDSQIVELRAWAELTKLIFTNSLDPQMGSACLLGAINQMPIHVLEQLTGTASISVTDFRELHGLSVAQYDNQLKRWQAHQKANQKSEVNVSFTSIVSQANAKN